MQKALSCTEFSQMNGYGFSRKAPDSLSTAESGVASSQNTETSDISTAVSSLMVRLKRLEGERVRSELSLEQTRSTLSEVSEGLVQECGTDDSEKIGALIAQREAENWERVNHATQMADSIEQRLAALNTPR